MQNNENNNQNNITFDQLIENTKKFEEYIQIPTKYTRLENVAITEQDKLDIANFACETKPIIHTKIKVLIEDFLKFKLEHGSNIEKDFYKGMDVNSFITRLLVKRPFTFLTGSDMACLRNGKRTAGGFDSIGTDEESAPLLLKDYISYDEMQISSMISVSSPTFFINEGGRYNCGKPSKVGTFERFGVYVGLIGARFERDGLMESQHMLITKRRNRDRGFGKGNDNVRSKYLAIWANFYGIDYFPTVEEVEQQIKNGSKDYLEVASFRSTEYFNIKVFRERIRMSVEPFFQEANERGKKANKKSFVRLVGIGLGVWMVTEEQTEFILQAVDHIVKTNDYPFISDIDFTWFPGPYKDCNGKRDGEFLKDKSGNNIKIHFTKNDPSKLLNEDKLLVCSYAWDGNSLPGNEYWLGSLSASGDPAAASCSLIGVLQNPHINTHLNGNNSSFYGN